MGTESFVNTADCEFRGISYKRISIGNFTKLALLSSCASWLCRTNPLSLFTRRSFPGESALIFPPPLWRRLGNGYDHLFAAAGCRYQQSGAKESAMEALMKTAACGIAAAFSGTVWA